MFARNGLDISLLEHVLTDGGGNFIGDVKGAVALLRDVPGARKIDMTWCPIHRFKIKTILIKLIFAFKVDVVGWRHLYCRRRRRKGIAKREAGQGILEW